MSEETVTTWDGRVVGTFYIPEPMAVLAGYASPVQDKPRRRTADLPPMLEVDFQQAVQDLCKTLGLLYYHTHNSRRSVPGFPDLVIVGPCGVLWRELKTERGRVTRDQQKWIDGLREAGENVAVWRPSDMPRIPGELAALRRTSKARHGVCVCPGCAPT